MKTSVSAVATSWRPRRPRSPIPSAPPREKTANPTMVLTPIRLAAAAPANDPFGTACATNAEPRRTTKNPIAPPTIATMVATIQALIMKPENISSTAPVAGGDGAGNDVGDEHERDHEEAHRPAAVERWPVIAVVREQHADPHHRYAERRRGRDRAAGAARDV